MSIPPERSLSDPLIDKCPCLIDWTVTGSGSDGGNGSSEPWLFDAPNTASVTFSVSGTAVSFMMNGDFNDGFAELKVEGTSVGTFDLF